MYSYLYSYHIMYSYLVLSTVVLTLRLKQDDWIFWILFYRDVLRWSSRIKQTTANKFLITCTTLMILKYRITNWFQITTQDLHTCVGKQRPIEIERANQISFSSLMIQWLMMHMMMSHHSSASSFSPEFETSRDFAGVFAGVGATLLNGFPGASSSTKISS